MSRRTLLALLAPLLLVLLNHYVLNASLIGLTAAQLCAGLLTTCGLAYAAGAFAGAHPLQLLASNASTPSWQVWGLPLLWLLLWSAVWLSMWSGALLKNLTLLLFPVLAWFALAADPATRRRLALSIASLAVLAIGVLILRPWRAARLLNIHFGPDPDPAHAGLDAVWQNIRFFGASATTDATTTLAPSTELLQFMQQHGLFAGLVAVAIGLLCAILLWHALRHPASLSRPIRHWGFALFFMHAVGGILYILFNFTLLPNSNDLAIPPLNAAWWPPGLALLTLGFIATGKMFRAE